MPHGSDPSPPPRPTEPAAAMETLLERNLPGLQAFVRLRAGPSLLSHESSSDLAQSVCRELLENRDRYRHQGEEEFRRWLYTTASRKIANRHAFHRAHIRNADRHAAVDAAGDDPALLDACRRVSTPSGRLVSAEEVARIEAVLGSLSEERREVILLSRVAELSHREIAEHQGRSEAACRVLLHRALADLAERLFRIDGKDGAPAT